MVPYYTRPSEAGIVAHYRAVAAASSLPIVAYNIPYRTGRGLGADALLQLAAIPGVVGVKQAVGALDRDTLAVLRDRPAGFHVLAGDDAYIGPLALMGGAGAIAATAHLRTSEFAAHGGGGTGGRRRHHPPAGRRPAGHRRRRVRRAVARRLQGRAGGIAARSPRRPCGRRMVAASVEATAAVLATLPQSARATDSSSNTPSSTAR